MSRHGRISRPCLLAAVTLALTVLAALQSFEWGHELVERLIEQPLTEVLRLAW